jgi:hypothetical protein
MLRCTPTGDRKSYKFPQETVEIHTGINRFCSNRATAWCFLYYNICPVCRRPIDWPFECALQGRHASVVRKWKERIFHDPSYQFSFFRSSYRSVRAHVDTNGFNGD